MSWVTYYFSNSFQKLAGNEYCSKLKKNLGFRSCVFRIYLIFQSFPWIFEIKAILKFPTDTDVFKMSSGRLKKNVTSSYDQTRRCHHVWKKTSDLRRLEDVWFKFVLKTSNLRRLEDVWFWLPWGRPVCHVLKTSDLRRFQDV